jgi:hypothetical protein
VVKIELEAVLQKGLASRHVWPADQVMGAN